nr:immunoglobulin heavy chain junction region [Macaca mulatta]MOW50982.1 immunoglobulin heavy chain junction region [Macaca mulatta]
CTRGSGYSSGLDFW